MFLSFIGFYCLQFFLIYGFVYHLYCYLFYHENVFIIIFYDCLYFCVKNLTLFFHMFCHFVDRSSWPLSF